MLDPDAVEPVEQPLGAGRLPERHRVGCQRNWPLRHRLLALFLPRPARTPVGYAAGISLATLALCTVIFGLYQGPLGAWLLAR